MAGVLDSVDRLCWYTRTGRHCREIIEAYQDEVELTWLPVAFGLTSFGSPLLPASDEQEPQAGESNKRGQRFKARLFRGFGRGRR